MEPVFHFLDGLIADYGLYIYMVVVWASPFLIAWILRGGLRRKRTRRDSTVIIPVIVLRQPVQPPAQPPPLPPVIGENPERGQWPSDDNDGEDSFAA
jgi:hypothetical protein